MRQHFTGTNIALVAVFAAFIAASTIGPEVPLALGVPVTLQTLAVVLAGLVLGPWRGAAAVVLYLAVGAIGVPIYADLGAGLPVLFGPTGGFLIGFIPAAWVAGAITVAFRRRGKLAYWHLLVAGLATIPVVYLFGIPWLAVRLQISLVDSAVAMGPFLVGDTIKVVIAAAVAAVLHRSFPQLLPAARPVVSQEEHKVAATA